MNDTPDLDRWRRRLLAADGVRDAELLVETRAAGPALPMRELVPSRPLPAKASGAIDAREEGAAEGRPSHVDGGALQLPADAPATLPATLDRAAADPGSGLLYLDGEGGEVRRSYADLRAESLRVLAGLRRLGLGRGDPVILQLEAAADFLPAFWGAVLGGMLPVPAGVAPSYREESAAVTRLRAAWELLDGPRVLTTGELVPEIAAAPGLAGLDGLRVESLDRLRGGEEEGEPTELGGSDPALLLLTSGSTGVPKGVVLTHANLLASAVGAIEMHGFHPRSVFLNWFPLDHVAGIVMFHLQPLYLGGDQIHGPMEAVLKRPELWLDWIERHRATVTWAPNFAYGLVNERVAASGRRWDLGSMAFILNGGEAIVPRTVRRFMRLLAPHGLAADAMHPGWGMSETSGGVVFEQGFRLETTRDDDPFVSLGQPYPGTELRIVDDEGRIVDEPQVGHLQIRGPSITPGYYRNPQATAESMREDGWFDTGDLGFLADGRLTITGRTKETIIIHGVNYHAHGIEQAVEECAGVERSFTAACAVRPPKRDTDELAIFFHPSEGADVREVAPRIREAVVREAGLRTGYIVPLPVEEIPKTSIGKIQRSELVRRFQAGELDEALRRVSGEGGEATVPDWFFRRAWPPAPLPEGGPGAGTAAGGHALLLVADSPYGAALARAWRAAGGEATVVRPGEAAGGDGDGFVARPGRRADLEAVVAELADRGVAVERAVHAWGHGAAGGAFASAEEAALSVVALRRALDDGTDLLVAATRVREVEPGEPVEPGHGTLPGLLASLAAEEPGRRVALVDLPGDEPGSEASAIVAEAAALAGDGERTSGEAVEVAYREGRRRRGALERVDLAGEPFDAAPVVPGGVYLVTGGLGGLGRVVCRWLLEERGARVVAVGRSELPATSEREAAVAAGGSVAERVRALEELEACGEGEVLYAAADIGDGEALGRVREAAEARWSRPLDGVFHLAGVHRERHWEEGERHRVAREEPAAFERTFAPKVAGTRALDALLEDRPGALFVAFSSVLGDLGGAGHAAYAAAASFQQSFAAHQRASGREAAHCLSWTMWDELGMSAESPQAVRDATRGSGFRILSPEEGVRSLEAALHRRRGDLVIGLDGDHPKILGRVTPASLRRRLVVLCAGEEERAATEVGEVAGAAGEAFDEVEVRWLEALPRTAAGELDRAALAAAEAGGEATSEVERSMAAIWSEVLQVPGVGRDDRFFEVGGDSLKATQLLQRVSATFGVDVPLRDFFDEPTVAGLADRVERVAAGGGAVEESAR